MNPTKTLMLAGFAALSLGAGSAMAQEGGSGLSVPAGGFGFYRAPQAVTTTQAPTVSVQSGSSDVQPAWHSPYNVSVQPQFDYSGAQ